MTVPLLEIEGLCKSFGAIQAVNDVSFEVREGEVLGIIGPNGSGKSTLFNCVLGQLKPNLGEIRFAGRPVTDLSPVEISRRGIGRTFQMLQVFGGMTVRDNLIAAAQEHRGSLLSRLFMAAHAGLSARTEEMLDVFHLSHLADEYAGELSFGQQKLLDIAMAFMAEPRLILLDEPASSVSPTMLGELKGMLERLNRVQGATFAVIEHNMEFVMNLSHRVLVLAQGSVLAVGTPEEIQANAEVMEAYLGD